MQSYNINDVLISTDRFKIFTLMCKPNTLNQCIDYLRNEKINVLNIGKELASYVDSLTDYSYLNIDVYDHITKLLEENKSKVNSQGNDVLAIYNLGILLEPRLELNPVQLIKEFSKSTATIIIWENEFETSGKLHWPTQKQNHFIEFSDIPFKKLQYAI